MHHSHAYFSNTKMCERCHEVDLSARHYTAHFCDECQSKRFDDNGGTGAHKAVRRAVKRGELPPAKTLKCVDCGSQARDYDHRDYAKPLEVQPVCRSCNRKRGPARPVLTFEIPESA